MAGDPGLSSKHWVRQVWRVLTDYDRLANFVPNLAQCERVGGAPPGRIRIRQRGCSQVRNMCIRQSSVYAGSIQCCHLRAAGPCSTMGQGHWLAHSVTLQVSVAQTHIPQDLTLNIDQDTVYA